MIALVLLLASPAQVPAAWTCDPAAFADGVVCDCGCDAPDDDCDGSEFDVCDTTGCAAGEVPWEHQNDQCMASTCGDGWKDTDEACDDKNALASGGCNADCSAVNDGFTCSDNAHGCVADVVAEGEGEGEVAEGEGDSDGEVDDGGCNSGGSGVFVGCAGVLLVFRRRYSRSA